MQRQTENVSERSGGRNIKIAREINHEQKLHTREPKVETEVEYRLMINKPEWKDVCGDKWRQSEG